MTGMSGRHECLNMLIWFSMFAKENDSRLGGGPYNSDTEAIFMLLITIVRDYCQEYISGAE